MGEQFPRFDELSVHPVAFAVCTLLALLAGGTRIAGAGAQRPLADRRGGWLRDAGTRKSRLPGILVALQIALTCILLVTGGLLVRTFFEA